MAQLSGARAWYLRLMGELNIDKGKTKGIEKEGCNTTYVLLARD